MSGQFVLVWCHKAGAFWGGKSRCYTVPSGVNRIPAPPPSRWPSGRLAQTALVQRSRHRELGLNLNYKNRDTCVLRLRRTFCQSQRTMRLCLKAQSPSPFRTPCFGSSSKMATRFWPISQAKCGCTTSVFSPATKFRLNSPRTTSPEVGSPIDTSSETSVKRLNLRGRA